jgi:hypothetical protein
MGNRGKVPRLIKRWFSSGKTIRQSLNCSPRSYNRIVVISAGFIPTEKSAGTLRNKLDKMWYFNSQVFMA